MPQGLCQTWRVGPVAGWSPVEASFAVGGGRGRTCSTAVMHPVHQAPQRSPPLCRRSLGGVCVRTL